MPLPLALGIVIEASVQYVFFMNMRINKFDIKEVLLYILFSAVALSVVVYFLVEFAFFGIVANALKVIIMTLIANVKVKILPLSAVYAIFANIIFLWAATLAGVVLDLVSFVFPGAGQFYTENIQESWVRSLIYSGTVFIIGFYISHRTGQYFNKKLHGFDAKLQKKLAINLLFGALIALSLFLVNSFVSAALEDIAARTMVYAVILTICFISLVFAVFAFADSLRKEAELKHKTELMRDLESYTSHVETIATEMRRFKHDHKNLMLGFHAHVEGKDWSRLENYYNQYMNEFSASETAIESCMDRLANVQTPELKIILFIKFLQVQRLGINIVIEVQNTVTITGDYNLLDTCRIVGILMDNAMEACQGVEGASVRLMGDMSGDNTYFIFQNTCNDPPPMNQLGKRGFSTKDGGRGLGLYNVSQLVKKNGNLTLKTKISGGNFTQELIVAPEIL